MDNGNANSGSIDNGPEDEDDSTERGPFFDKNAMIKQLQNDAYYAVLRAFKAESESVSGERAALLQSLKKQFQLTFKQHRSHLERIQVDEAIKMLRPPVSQMEDKKKETKAVSRPSKSLLVPHASTRNVLADEPPESLLGKIIWIRLSRTETFEEVIITEYNKEEGLHALECVAGNTCELWGWVDIKEVPPENIRVQGDYLGARPRTCSLKPGHTVLRPSRNAGKGKASDDNGLFKVPPLPTKDKTTADPIPRRSTGIKLRMRTSPKKGEEAGSPTPPVKPESQEGQEESVAEEASERE